MTLLAAVGPDTVARVVAELESGRPVVVPTDTVYGLGARVDDVAAAERIFELKDRPTDRLLPVLVASTDQADRLGWCDDRAHALMRAFWPGPLTIVVERRDGAAPALGADATTVGVRCPDEALVRAVAERVGPLAVTSANRHGVATPVDAAGVADQLAEDTLLVVDAGPRAGRASTVVDLSAGRLRILREGSVTEDQLRAVVDT